MGHTEYFVNDDVFYDLKTSHVSFATVNFRKLSYLPFNNLVLMKGYFITIELVTKDDKKKQLQDTRILFYIIDLVGLPAIFIFGGFVLKWQWSSLTETLILPIAILLTGFNIFLLLYCIYDKEEANRADKIIITGDIIDVIEQGGGFPRLDIYFGIENFNVTSEGVKKDFTIGEPITLLYILKRNEKRGGLIRVEKISSK